MIPKVQEVRIGPRHALGGENPPLFVAGPCVIESREMALRLAERLARIAEEQHLQLVFKASFDKANRTSLDSFRGPGLEAGLRILEEVKRATGLPVTSDVHSPEQARAAARVLDLIQVPAFLCRQTDLLVAAAGTQRPVNVKKGQFLAPEDVGHILGKVHGADGTCCITERGTTFGYHDLVVDMRSFPAIRGLDVPVIFDATHSTQRPGGRGASSGGSPEFCAPLARAAAAAGVDGFFFEVHEDPCHALSDPATQVAPELFAELAPLLLEISARVRAAEEGA
jgi:2-dehydro-3-deoxyphosphooctonate aldolase (KDO 8-P synthase)